MSNQSLLLAVGLALVGFFFRLSEVFFGWLDIAFYIYLLLVLIAIFIGLRETYLQENSTNFNILFKGAMKPAALFIVLVGLLQIYYFKEFNPGYFDEDIAEMIAEAEANNYTKEQISVIIKNMRQFTHHPIVFSTMQLFALLFISLAYGAISTFIFIKVKVFRTF